VVLNNLTRDPSVCCCHIRGTVTNGNTVPVHVIMQFSAMPPDNSRELARIVNFARISSPARLTGYPTTAPAPPDFCCRAIRSTT
jgi:hypothetical protein